MKYTEEQISQLLEHADPDTAALIRVRLNLIESLRILSTELRNIQNSNEALRETADDMYKGRGRTEGSHQ